VVVGADVVESVDASSRPDPASDARFRVLAPDDGTVVAWKVAAEMAP